MTEKGRAVNRGQALPVHPVLCSPLLFLQDQPASDRLVSIGFHDEFWL